jgi:hypothetical protein
MDYVMAYGLCHDIAASWSPSTFVLFVALCGPLLPPTGSWFNIIMTGTQIVVIVIILAAGFSRGKTANLTPFLPFG